MVRCKTINCQMSGPHSTVQKLNVMAMGRTIEEQSQNKSQKRRQILKEFVFMCCSSSFPSGCELLLLFISFPFDLFLLFLPPLLFKSCLSSLCSPPSRTMFAFIYPFSFLSSSPSVQSLCLLLAPRSLPHCVHPSLLTVDQGGLQPRRC